MTTRIYKVTTPQGERLVEASGKSQAIRHCVSGDYAADPVSASDMYALIQAGIKVEKAVEEKKSEAGAKSGPATSTTSVTPTSLSNPVVAANPSGETAPSMFPPFNVSPQAMPASAADVIAEQQRINPAAAAAAGAAPLPPAPPAVDWQAREQAS